MNAQLMESCLALAARDDGDLAAELLARHPVHVGVSPAEASEWAAAATAYGVELAARTPEDAAAPGTVAHRRGGVRDDRILLAEYRTRPAGVVVYDDAVERAEELVAALGWHAWFPPGSVVRAAVAHEAAHRLLCGTARRELRERVGRVVVRLGSWRWHAHVAGADELAAHAFAGERCGLGRSPVLLTLALAELAAEHPPVVPVPTLPKEA